VNMPSYSSSSLIVTALPPSAIRTLSLHDALPISCAPAGSSLPSFEPESPSELPQPTTKKLINNNKPKIDNLFFISSLLKYLLKRSEEHTSELQSRFDLVCRLLLEKKKKRIKIKLK